MFAEGTGKSEDGETQPLGPVRSKVGRQREGAHGTQSVLGQKAESVPSGIGKEAIRRGRVRNVYLTGQYSLQALAFL